MGRSMALADDTVTSSSSYGDTVDDFLQVEAPSDDNAQGHVGVDYSNGLWRVSQISGVVSQ